MALRASDIDAMLSPAPAQPRQRGLRASDIDALIGAPTLNARASGSAGLANKKSEAIWGGSFDDWKKRKEADDAERARMVAESEAGNVGSRRAQDFQRKVAALNKEGDQTGDYSADSLRAGRSLEMGMEQGREQIGAGLQFAGETPLALADFFGRIRPKGETEQDRSNPVTEAGKDIRGAAVARQQEIAPLMIDRPESLLSVQGAKYIAQSALQSAPTTGTGLAAAVINPAAGLSLMGAGAGSAKFADARAEDKNYWLSAEAGAAAAAAEVVPEMLPLGFLSGRLLKHLPGTAMKRMASSPAGRGALLSLSEGASEGVTELSNIAYEIAREGKTYSDDEIANRLIDATAVGTVMGGGMAAVAEATGQSARAYDQSKIADLELENSLRAAIKPRATTARILGPTATPDAAAGAQIADDAFRAAGVGTVAAADMAEQDALARDLDAAQLDQLGSEAEIDRLLTGNAPRERTDLYRASIPGAIPQGMQVTSNQDAFAAPGTIGGRDAPAPIQVTTLADRSVFVPGDPAAIRQKLADAGSQWQGMAQERDGVAGVRFSPTSWTDVQGLIGGSIAPTANVAPEVAEAPAAAPPIDLTARRTNSDTKFDERVHDLTDFIALNGGLDRSALESEGIDPANWNSRKAKGQNDKFFGKPLFRKTGGMTLETLREKARDAGFRTDKDVLDLIGDSLGGRKTFTPAGSEYQMALADVARQEADAQARQQRVNALPLSVPETDADAYIASRETEFDAPADRDGADLADIESTLASVADTSPQQRASVVSLGHDYTAKLIELKRARAAGALNPDQQEAYIDLLEQDRETGKVAGRPMVGIGNKTAYVDALMQGKLMPVQAFLDADNFKALNDKFGHDVGDDVIRLMADVVRDEFGEGNVFHRGGDEFLTQGMTQEEVDARMARVQDYLARVKMELPLSDGRTATLTGVGVSYGTGANEKAADDSLKQDKQRRKDAGLRFDRREGDDAGRVGSQSASAGTEASGANSRDSSRAAAEGVGDERTTVPSGGLQSEFDAAVRVPTSNTERASGDAESVRRNSINDARSTISRALGPKFLRRLESQPWFHLVESLDQLPPDVRKSITGDDIAGFVLPDGRVYIIADSVGDNATGIVLHEVGVHFGMSGLPEFPSMLREFKRMRARSAEVDRAYKSVPEDTDASLIDEEAFAYYVEQNWATKSPLMTRIKDAIARLLNRLGIPTSGITDALMRQALDGMIARAREAADKASRGVVTVRDGKIVYHKAWHGTPHDFDKFRWDDSTASTGEGAQAYGYGLYFAGNKDVAAHYRDAYGNKSYFFDGKELPQGYFRQAAKLVADSGTGRALSVMTAKLEETGRLLPDAGPTRAKMLTALQEDLKDVIFWLESITQSDIEVRNSGKLYEVELAPNESDYLDWDAPLSEQSEKVRDALTKLPAYKRMAALASGPDARIFVHPDKRTGGDFYRMMDDSDREASRVLHAAGIPGIRYLDGSSRNLPQVNLSKYKAKVDAAQARRDADPTEENESRLSDARQELRSMERANEENRQHRNYVIFDDSQVEVKAKYSRRADGGSVGGVKTLADLRPEITDAEPEFDANYAPKDDEYLYHVTSEPAAKAIAANGFKPASKMFGHGAYAKYSDGRVFFTERSGLNFWKERVENQLFDKFDDPPDVAVVRVKRSDVEGMIEPDKTGSDDARRPAYFITTNRQAPPREGLGASGAKFSRRTITIDGTERPTTDSTGKPIHPTEEGVRNFWRWFSGSAIVDDQGRPIPVHHGTKGDIASFDGGRQGQSDFGASGRGFYFSQDPGTAGVYAELSPGDGSPNIVPAYVAIRNPLELGALLPQNERESKLLTDRAKANGYDGIVVRNADGVLDEVVAFEPEQAKSALGNSGTFSPTDARIAYSRKTPAEARAESAQKQADLGAQLVVSPGQSFVYTDQFTDDWRGQTLKMRERIQDKLLSVRNVQQDIEKIRGAIQDAMNVYRRENLMHGRVGDQRDKLQDSHVKPLIEAMAEAKVSPALLEDYLEARHAKERNEKIAATKGGMPDGASGMTTQQAEDFLQGRAAGHRSGVTLDPAMTRQVSRLGRKVYAITAETRRRLLDSGQITQEAFDALENAYAAYVPLRGKDGTEGGKGRGTGKGIDVRGKPVLRAAGRGEGNRAQNILAEVIADAERSIINAEKLRVGRTLARLVLENPNPDVWAIEPVKTELKVSEGTPEEIYEAVKNLDQEEGTIIVKVKGKPYRIVIEDQRMADALKNMAVETVPEVIQYVAGLNRYFSAVLTRYNPSFVGVNMTRDLLFGITGIWAEHGTAAAAKAAASYFPAMRAAWRDIQGKPPVNAMGRYAREFAEAGGKTYFGKLENVSDMSQRIGEEFKTFRQMAMPKFLGGEMSPVRALAKVARDSKMVQAIEAVNDTVENTLRLSVYAARREAGASIEQAAEYAKNISVNFNRRGSATSWLNALYLFFNAATQGAHRTLTLLKNPKVQGVLGGLAALQATSAMFLMGLDDEDGEPLWDSISSWDKQRNLILAIPIKREKGWGATVIKIPMPYGFNLFPYMGGRSVELARDLQEKPVSRAIADYTTDAVVGVAQAMSPIPFDDGWKAALPHWVRIFTVLSENKDDLGIPIRAGDQYDSFDKPRSASGRDDTPRPFKIAATALNRLGGGDDYTPPYAKFALDWAPEDLAYLFKTFAGGLGSNVVKSGTLTEKLIAGVPVNFTDVPLLSSFVSNVDQRQATSTRYYDHKDDIEREVARQRDLAKETGEVGDNPMGIKIARNKSGAKVKRGEGYELEGKPGSLFDTYKQAEKDISRIRDEMRAAFNDQSISYTERIRKIDELKAEREEVQRELNAAWREQRKKRTQ